MAKHAPGSFLGEAPFLLRLIRGCLNDKDPGQQERSWKLFHWFLINCGADGAAGEELSFLGPSVAHYTDDQVLYKLIRESPLERVRDLPFSPRYHFHYDKLTAEEKGQFRKKQPAVVRAIEYQILRTSGLSKEGAEAALLQAEGK